MGLIAPFPKSTWSSPFGEWPQWRKDMGLGPHRGMDFSVDEDTPIPASGRGVAVGRGWQDAIGNWVVIRYATEFGDVHFGYCHLREQPNLPYGTWVATGQTIAHVGNTGSATTGAHLHLTASPTAGNPAYVAVVDPAPYFTSAAVASVEETPVTEEEIRMAFDGIEIVKFSDTGLSLYVVAQDGRMAKIEDPDVAQQLSAIKSGTFSGKYSRAQFTETRTFLKNLFGIPL